MKIGKKDSWWVKYVDSQSRTNEFQQTCKHKNFTILDFCVMINDIATKLGPGNYLLDIGAGNGLIDISLMHLYKKIYAVEPASELFSILDKNLKLYKNIIPINSYAEQLSINDNILFDRILLAGVAPQLDNPMQLYKILDQCLKFSAKKCRILIARVSDLDKKNKYISNLPDLLRNKGFKDSEIEIIIDRNQRSSWHNYHELKDYFTTRGFNVKKVNTDPNQLLYNEKFDIIAEQTLED